MSYTNDMRKIKKENLCTIEHELGLDIDSFCHFGDLENRCLSEGHDKPLNITRESFNDESESLSIL